MLSQQDLDRNNEWLAVKTRAILYLYEIQCLPSTNSYLLY